MSKPYASGELPKVGDEIDMGLGSGPKGVVVVVIGDLNHGASDGFNVDEWKYLGSGILVQTESMGLVFDDGPNDEAILLKRSC